MIRIRPRSLPFLVVMGLGALGLSGCVTDGNSGLDREVSNSPGKTQQEEKADQVRLVDALKKAIEDGRISDARFIIGRLRSSGTNQPEAHLADAEIAFSEGKYDEALAAFKKLTSTSEVSARAYQGIGLSLLFKGKSEEAKKNLEKAVSMDSRLWRAWNGLGYYHDQHRQWQEAEESYTRALGLKPQSDAIINNRGFSQLMQGHYGRAARDFRRVLELNPTSKIARANLRMALAWSGKYREALAGTDPDSLVQALNNVGYIAMIRGDLATAEAYFSRAMEASPSFDEQAAANLRRLDVIRASKKTPKKQK